VAASLRVLASQETPNAQQKERRKRRGETAGDGAANAGGGSPGGGGTGGGTEKEDAGRKSGGEEEEEPSRLFISLPGRSTLTLHPPRACGAHTCTRRRLYARARVCVCVCTHYIYIYLYPSARERASVHTGWSARESRQKGGGREAGAI